MTHNGKFCQKSGLDWVKMANFGHFAGFPSPLGLVNKYGSKNPKTSQKQESHRAYGTAGNV